MASFLIVPVNSDENVFKAGVLLYLASLQRKKNVLYSRLIQSKSLSESEIALESSLDIDSSHAVRLSVIDHALSSGKINDLSEKIATYYYSAEIQAKQMIIVEGIAPDPDRAYLFNRNRSIAAILKAEVVFLVDVKDKSAQRAVELIKTVHDICFEPDTQKLGFILLNVPDNKTDYVNNVSNLILKSKIDLACLLALDSNLSKVDSKEELNEIATKVEFSTVEYALNRPIDTRMAPAVYRYLVIEKAKKAGKKIVLPEGTEPRTIEAAIICHQKNIAQCILLAKREEVAKVAAENRLVLPDEIEIIEPQDIADNYVDALVEIRKNKGLTKENAKKMLQDEVFLGTMMLQLGEVDGLVSGAVHTTADTIRPALQIIKTNAQSTMVSSIFFMLMPNEVYVFGDCAVNTDPNAEQLAEIAIQSADSATAFGIDPKVAMISFSTINSGSGPSVDKVKQATAIVKSKRPDILVDGPLQYDAACDLCVGQKKAPGSSVAGRANVFIFPNLDTGNTVYKAVQRTGNILSVGPMLQGLNKAVNDLSRGASVEDIVFTIAITAIQAVQKY